jgi:hypothetical protein
LGNALFDPDAFHLGDEWRGDCFHPNAIGQEEIAGFVEQALSDLDLVRP